ncbi:5'-nucleotidase, lipoprotein e(P4) family [Mammaliicoccus sp. P-M56]|uniref:5'-nucleotidase, lipoprotein e(P4) family n=1 Tax=Mammaliicoccus sp. P-M56 TaxID=2898715 RepID=UPI001EFC231F|nr:5'-nucleotidase, lipoprotein e(P4) family [Mammaliicoccus sp. P-M56]
MKKLIASSALVVLLGGTAGTVSTNEVFATQTATKEVQKEKVTKKDLAEQNIMSVAWYQTSAEAKALYLQGYNSAKDKLDEKLKHHKGKKKPAIVLDLDETVLDNSPYQAYASLKHKTFPEGWHEWIATGNAKPVYGSKEFLKYADKKGVEIFYVSDRDQKEDFKGTLKNMKDLNMPQADKEHILLKGENEKGKTERREKVRKNHDLIMLFGDNILDFDEPKESTLKSRTDFVTKHKKDFGDKYIIFPNPMYGSWEATLYGGNFDQTPEKIDQLRKKELIYFDPSTNTTKKDQVK